jgi:magnesium transporter
MGARPGTLSIPDDALEMRIHVIRFDADEVVEEDPDGPAGIQLPDGQLVWVDVQGFGDADALWALAGLFELHPLALEDMVHVPQRPKVDRYDGYDLLITRMLKIDDDKLDMEQLAIAVGPGWVLTMQERYGDVLDPVRRRIREGVGPIRKSGTDYLAYAILDTVVDGYYPVVELRGEQIEALEDVVFERPTQRTLAQINHIKRDLAVVRRTLGPQREALNRLVRDPSEVFGEDVRTYLRDTQDHCTQATEVTDSQRELVNGLMNMYLSVVSNRMNEVMKVLTVMASIFIPLTFLAGIYGMNFDNMPELHARWGYPILLVVMIVTGVGMVVFFRRKGWLGGSTDRN